MRQITATNVYPDEGQKALWERINTFPLDEQGAALPFSRKLASEQGWDRDFTQQAIAEYRKFIFLCCISPHGASPSEVIDEVWHLHLLYTQNYWEEFCGKVLERSLHHHPSQGGAAEHARHQQWHTETLMLYLETFGTPPPRAYWNNKPPEKPGRRWWQRSFPWPLLIPLLLLTGCKSSSFSFLFLAGLFFIIGKIAGSIRRYPDDKQHTRRGSNESSSGSTGSSCSSSSCGSSCGSGCGGGCGGCGGS